jgi:bifunctional non-homologous end joining protein LigD
MTTRQVEEASGNADRQPEPTGAESELIAVRSQTPGAAIQIKAFFHQRFEVKKHDATNLHYDLRLAWNGVMKSWALHEGPTLCAGERREAVEMPDHSKRSMDFEGVIPAPRYGAGIVMQWDAGLWEPHPSCMDVDAALRNGFLKIVLYGKKLKGHWTLTRIGGGGEKRRKPIWHFIKEADVFARSSEDRCILEEEPNSSRSGRNLEEIRWEWDHGRARGELQPTLF